MPVKLTRKIPARTETLQVDWYKRDFITYSERFRQIRAKSRNRFDKCFLCKHGFIVGDQLTLAHFAGIRGNKAVCNDCVQKIDQAEAAEREAGESSAIEDSLMQSSVAFGLKAQGHLEKIEKMLANGILWPDIASAIGWCPGTARGHYELAAGNQETRELRAAVATAIELIRCMASTYKDRMSVSERNACAAAYSRGNRLLASRTPAAFP